LYVLTTETGTGRYVNILPITCRLNVNGTLVRAVMLSVLEESNVWDARVRKVSGQAQLNFVLPNLVDGVEIAEAS
jgi:hypothetical protein